MHYLSEKGEEREKMISAKLLVEIGSRITKMRLRRHFLLPQKGKIKVEKADLQGQNDDYFRIFLHIYRESDTENERRM